MAMYISFKTENGVFYGEVADKFRVQSGSLETNFDRYLVRQVETDKAHVVDPKKDVQKIFKSHLDMKKEYDTQNKNKF